MTLDLVQAASANDLTEAKAVLLPRFVTLRSPDKKYLSTTLEGKYKMNVRCEKTAPDSECTFQIDSNVGQGQNWFLLSDGTYGGQMRACKSASVSDGIDVACTGNADQNPRGIGFTYILASGNFVYLLPRVLSEGGVPTGQHWFLTSKKSTISGGWESLKCSTDANEACQWEVIEPVLSKKITDIHYDLPAAKVLAAQPLIVLNGTVRNHSTSSPSTETLNYSYTKSKTGTWNNTAGVQIGAKATFEAGVPFVADAKLELSISASYSHSWGGSEGESQTVSESTAVQVPPGKKAKVTVVVKRANLDVNFTYHERTEYMNGRVVESDSHGTYHNVDSFDVDVEIGDWEPINA